jgi:hypothetical protein
MNRIIVKYHENKLKRCIEIEHEKISEMDPRGPGCGGRGRRIRLAVVAEVAVTAS